MDSAFEWVDMMIDGFVKQRERVMMKKLTMVLCMLAVSCIGFAEAGEKVKKEKLQIVFLFGQSNMVGLGGVQTAWYLTQPQWIPPRDAVLTKPPYFNWSWFYWMGVKYYDGPRRAEIDALLDEREASRIKWRERVKGKRGPWNEKEWGPKPGRGRSNMYDFLDAKAEEEGIYKRIAEILDAPDNKLPMEKAYEQLSLRDKAIAAELARVREIYLKGTKGEDFEAFDKAVSAAVESGELILIPDSGSVFPEAEKHRASYAALAKKYVNLPVGERTRIYVHGSVAGSEGNSGIETTTYGPISVGYGSALTTMGPEYAVGITLERLVDAPILLVKCAWGNTALNAAWLPPSLSGDELSWCWQKVMPQVEKVLADPGAYHPDYDPEKGYEVAGLVWFQGYSDMGNDKYGDQLAQLIRDFREKVKTPDMPVVCGTLGHAAYEQVAFSSDVNRGMLKVSQMPEFQKTVDLVNTAPFYPVELDLLRQSRLAYEEGTAEREEVERIKKLATSKGGSTHYHGSAKFFLLTGDAMARSLANLMAGGEPMIHAKEID
jgi:hypothetical protein